MTISEYAIKRPVTTVMVFIGIVFLGLIAIFELPQELFPRISFPQITVVTDYVNAAPEEIETLITRPLEEAISSVSGLKRIESLSREGKSTITVSFNWNQNIDFAALAVREKIDLVKERLPKEAEDPVVLKFDPLSRPILILSVSGKASPAELKQIAERTLQDNLEKVEGVASVIVSGGLDREIQVELDQGRMQATGISILEVINQIDSSNISYPAGSIKKGLYEYLIRTVGEFKTVDEISYTVLKSDPTKPFEAVDLGFVERGAGGPRQTLDTKREETEKGIREKRLVLLHDVGEVKDRFREKTTISRFNKNENISIAIQKQATANTVELVRALKRTLAFLQEEVASRGAQFEIVYDHSEFIKNAIKTARNNAIAGGFLASIILFIFLRDWKSATIIAIAIPISVVGAFLLLKMQGITLNTMSLSGMALGTGMMVDNCIVVIENIFRSRERGISHEEASIQGTNEVFWPVVSSTLTTDAVFLPLILFVPGVAGQLFKDLSWAVIHSSNISFLVSVWLIPMLALYVEPKAEQSKVSEKETNTQNFFKKLPAKAQNRIFLQIVAAGILSFVIGIFIFRTLDTEVIPKVDQGQFLVKVTLPVGSRIEATDSVVSVLEETLNEIPEVESVQVTIGSSSGGKAGEVKVESLRSSQGLVLVSLKKDRKRESHEVLNDFKTKVESAGLEKATIEYILQENEYEFAATGGGKPIAVEVKGYDLDVLKSLAAEVSARLQNIEGVREILDDIGESSPETKVEIDKKKASLYAISARDVSLTAKAAIDGAVATTFKEAGREIDVRVKLKQSDRHDLERLSNLLLFSDHLNVAVPLKAIANIKQGFGPSEIKRKDQIRTLMVTASIQKGFKEKDVLKKAAEVLSLIEHPNSYDIKLVGKAREVEESFRRIGLVIVLALVLNYMIMAGQFESFIQPLIVMFTVPLAVIGVALALLLTGTKVSVISLLGIMILAGTVVNNAIVLIDFINQRRAEGGELVESAIQASFVRFRPILMSALTTLCGLIPLALGIGEGSELESPLAIAIGGGTISGTLFTLFVIPSVYILVVRASDALMGLSDIEEAV